VKAPENPAPVVLANVPEKPDPLRTIVPLPVTVPKSTVVSGVAARLPIRWTDVVTVRAAKSAVNVAVEDVADAV
jgi:hypothetical protein